MDKVRLGLIGVKGRATGLIKSWSDPGGKYIIAGGADINKSHLELFKQQINNPDVYVTTDYNELLQRKDIDAIAVMTPDYCHAEHAIAALKAGKHVFCEKPMGITVEECDEMLKAWKESGKRLMMGHNMRYMRMFRVMKEIIDSGAIGEVKAVWVRHFVGRGGEFYYHDWHGSRKYTNTLLLQKGCHDIDIIHWLAGQYSKKVTAFGDLDYYGGDKPNDLKCAECPDKESCIECYIEDKSKPLLTRGKDYCAYRKEIDVEDNNVMIMELDGGIKASYMQCHFTPDYHRNYTVIGTEGRLENSEPEGKVWVKTRRSNTWREYADRTYELKKTEGGHGGGDTGICEEFANVVLYDRDPIITPEAARMSVAAGCAGAESMRWGGKLMEVKSLPDWFKQK